MRCKLALENGCIFAGQAFGAAGTRAGEVVFNTALTGYQEVFTDPSYCRQIVTMTYPLLGNTGINPEDFEAREPFLAGVVIKELPRRPSNYRATRALDDFLANHGIVGLADVDTRALTRRLRISGALRGVLSTEIDDDLELVRRAQAAEPMSGANLVPQVATKEVAAWDQPLVRLGDEPAPPRPTAAARIVALDCGIKHNILRHLAEWGGLLTVVPASASAAEIRALRPAGLLVGNGPGDPAAVTDLIATLRSLLGAVPMLGICLGHQLLALAMGAQTYKLSFGHHGANMPVLNRVSGRVEITSQNHGFAVDAASLERAGGTVTHVNLNDGSLEGYLHRDHRIACVQFHPEASPGPHDAGYLFRRFVEGVGTGGDIAAVFAAADRAG